jgi:hypothetical protein
MNRVISVFSLVLLLGLISSFPGQRAGLLFSKSMSAPSLAQQDYTKKTTEGYMETVLSRNTKPLGLKENVVLRNLLKQPAIKWAVRAGIRHILD